MIVATSSLELGLDVGDLDRVIQIDAPPTVSSFLQRMGRTGRRAGSTSNCLFLATTDEGLLRAAALARPLGQGFVEPVNAPPKPFHILAQQLMALILQERGIGRSEWFGWMEAVPAFRQMDRQVVRSLVNSMIECQILWSDDGILSFAPEGEASTVARTSWSCCRCSRRLRSSGCLGQEGTRLRPRIDILQTGDGPSILVLAGRSWKTNHLDWRRRIAHVEPRTRGAVTMAGRRTVPGLPGLPGHPGHPGGRFDGAVLVPAEQQPPRHSA